MRSRKSYAVNTSPEYIYLKRCAATNSSYQTFLCYAKKRNILHYVCSLLFCDNTEWSHAKQSIDVYILWYLIASLTSFMYAEQA